MRYPPLLQGEDKERKFFRNRTYWAGAAGGVAGAGAASVAGGVVDSAAGGVAGAGAIASGAGGVVLSCVVVGAGGVEPQLPANNSRAPKISTRAMTI